MAMTLGRAGALLGAAYVAQWVTSAALAPVDLGSAAVGAAGPALSPVLLVGAALALREVVRPAGIALPWLLLLLPWLAPSLPAAWVFVGPGTAMVWMAAGTAAIASIDNWSPLVARVWHSPLAPVVAGALWLGAAAAAVAPHAMSGDAPHYLTIAQSMVDDGDLNLTNNYDRRTYAPFYGGSLEPRHANLSPWGEEYSFHGIGVAVMVAPAFALAGPAGATWTLVAVMSLGAALVWAAVRALTGQPGAAWFAWACLVGSAPYTFQAGAIYPDGPAAVAVAGALWLLARGRNAPPVTLTTLALVGAGLATLPWLHVRLALPAAVFGAACGLAVLRVPAERWTRLSWLFLMPPISAAAWFAASYVQFDTWNPMAAMLQRTAPGGLGAAPAGLFGLLCDHEFGLLPTSPVYLLAPLGLGALWRRSPVLAAAGGIAAAGVASMASLWGWWGGDSAPARLLTVILPVLAVALGMAWAEAHAGLRRVLVFALGLSVTLTALMAVVDGGSHAYNVPDGLNSIFQVMSPAVDLSRALPSMFRPGAAAGSELPVALGWLGAAVLAAVMLAWRPDGRAAGLAACAALAAGSGAAALGWRLHGVEAFTPAAARLHLVNRMAEGGLAIVGTTWPGTSMTDLAAHLPLRTPESVPRPDGVLLQVPNVPAGTYSVRVGPGAGGSAATTLTVEIGRDAWPYASWKVSEPGPTLTLATAVHSVRVVGSPASALDVWLAPLSPPHRSDTTPARRVTRIGAIDVYALDDSTFAESQGFWTGADRTTSLLLASPAPRVVTMQFTAGPADVHIDVGVDGVSTASVTLPAGTTTEVPVGAVIPTTPLAVQVTTRGGFPARRLREGDSRTLGAWMTVSSRPQP